MKKTLLAALIITSTTGIAHANNSGFYIGAQAGGGLFSLGNPSLNASFSNTTELKVIRSSKHRQETQNLAQ